MDYYNYDYLIHYGIKGQKWGVRRYQNPDGSLTPAGRKRVYASSKRVLSTSVAKKRLDAYALIRKRDIDKSGIKSTDDPNTDVISKNTKLYRVANSNEPINNKRKYASITDQDRSIYQEVGETLSLDKSAPISSYAYSAKKDLRVATGKKVANDLIDKYGDKHIKELYDDIQQIGVSDLKSYTKNFRVKNKDKFADDYLKDTHDQVKKFMNNTMNTHMDEIVDTYKKQGYDAIVDVYDVVNELAHYPVVLLEPDHSIRLEREDRWDVS